MFAIGDKPYCALTIYSPFSSNWAFEEYFPSKYLVKTLAQTAITDLEHTLILTEEGDHLCDLVTGSFKLIGLQVTSKAE